MKLLFLPVPGHGHVNPTLAVAAELVGRGHEVTYLLTEPFRDAVTAAGARFVLLDAPVMEGGPPPQASGAAPFALLMDELLGISEVVAGPLRELYDSAAPDALVVESMSLWGRLLALAVGARTVALSPSYVMGGHSPVTARVATILGGSGPPPVDTERIGAVAARYGADPARLVGFPFGPPAPSVVVFMPAAFHPGGDAMPPGVRFVGPMTTRAETDGFDLGEMATEPGPFVSLGTVFHDRPQFWRDCLSALGDRPAVVAHGRGFDPSGLDVPPRVVLAPHVPQLRVLAHASVFVTHGGMNSVMEAAAFGVPMVVVPQMVEQEVTADRVAELGMGVRLSPGDVTAETLAAALARVEGDPSFRAAAREMGAACAAAGGAPSAADAVEAAARP